MRFARRNARDRAAGAVCQMEDRLTMSSWTHCALHNWR